MQGKDEKHIIRKIATEAQITTAKADMKVISAGLMMYKLNAGNYPTTEQGLKVLWKKPTIDPIPRRWVMVMDKEPKDPWGNPYRYSFPGKKDPAKIDLSSDGADAVAGNKDDVVDVD